MRTCWKACWFYFTINLVATSLDTSYYLQTKIITDCTEGQQSVVTECWYNLLCKTVPNYHISWYMAYIAGKPWESSFTPKKRFIIWTFQWKVMVSLLETALEANSHAKPVRESISRGPFTLHSLRNSISFSYLSRRVVPSINIPTSKLSATFDHLINYMILQPYCWVPYSTFVLPCSSWTCEVNPLGSPTSSLRLPFGYAVLCGLVSDCGSAVVRRSSRSLRGFGASLPVAWSHPTFVRYKASYTLFAASYLCSFDLLSWRSGHPCTDSYR